MRNRTDSLLEQWKLLELEPIERQEQIINRLAPPTPRGLASKFTENEINEILEKRNIEVLAVPGDPQQGGNA